MEEISEERPDVKVGKINVDEQPELARQFHVMSIPTLVVMKDGKITDRALDRPRAQGLKVRFSPCCRDA